MPFTGSNTLLAQLIVQNMTPLVNASDPTAVSNLQATANAMANAIVTWILQSGTNSIVAQIAPGIPVVGAGGGVPGPMSGATTAPGVITTSSLI